MTWTDILVVRDACSEAVEWAQGYDTPEAAWDACERGDWLLWIAALLCDRRVVVLAACDCAELAKGHWREQDREACQKALDTARAWARGEASIEEVRKAAAAAAAYAAYAAAATAAYAADAANSAYAAAYAADAANSAYAAAYAADASYVAYTTRLDILKECADIVRKHIPQSPAKEDAHATR